MLRPWTEIERASSLFDELRRRLDNAFEDLGPWYGRRYPVSATLFEASWPHVNVDDAGTKLVVSAELPGMAASDIKLAIDRNVLTLSGERSTKPPKDYAVHRQERRKMRFSRSFTLPCAVDAERVSAVFNDGLLTVSVEKAAEAKPRTIAVKGS
jgi:HSP20 family protein